MLDNPTFDVARALRPVRRSIGLRQVAFWAFRGLAGGAIAGVLLLLSAHVRAWPATPAALAVLIAGVVIGSAIGCAQWPDLMGTARAVDRHVDLGERLTTALELRATDGVFADLQRADTMQRVSGLRLRGGPKHDRRGIGIGVAVSLLAFVALLDFQPAPTPQTQTVNQALQQRLHRATQILLPRLSRTVQRELPAGRRGATLRAVQRALLQLRRELRRARGTAQALREVSSTQGKIESLTGALPALTTSQLNRLARTLGVRSKTRQSPPRTVRQQSQAVQQRLHHLARQVSHLNATQTRTLGRTLQEAAQHTGGALQHTLRQASKALLRSRLRQAARWLNRAANTVHAAQSTRSQRSVLHQTTRRLSSLKNTISGLHGNPGKANQNGRPATHSQSATSQSGRAQRGNTKGSARTSLREAGPPVLQNRQRLTRSNGGGSGQSRAPAGTPNKGQRAGSAGTPGERDKSGTFHGTYTRVFVPGQVRSGPHGSQVGLSNRAQPGKLVPYHRVVARYTRAARTALDRITLPPPVQSYVRQYFSTIAR
ncbi:MAG TPA: hypothetical protein VKV02_08575 [Acidobacteriaceae bacterium]|nr:hypothetical protein [Acidobacteriaceae bacterium]